MVSLATLAGPTTASILALPGQYTGNKTFGRRLLVAVLENVEPTAPGHVRLDLTHSVDRSRQVTVARSPVERAVADNIRLHDETVSISGSISATPLGRILSGLAGSFGSYVRRDLRMLEQLYAMQAAREPVSLVWGKSVWPSMAMSIQSVHDGSHKVDLTLRFEQIKIVSPLTVEAALDLDETLIGASSVDQVGAQSTEVVTEPADVAGGLGG